MESNDPLRLFSLQFFKELGANVVDSGKNIEVTGVPAKFQKFYGKNEPYKLVFDKNLSSEGELITNESYLLKMMRAYLDNSGDSVLVSLNYKLNVDSLIKDNFTLQNCSLVKATANLDQNFLFKFTFQTTYKYLNEEEKFVNEVYVDNGNIINPDLALFTTVNLNKKDIDMSKLRDYYSIAKESIKDAINRRTAVIASILEDGISKEVARINSYYEQHLKEIDLQIAKINSSGQNTRLKDPLELEKQKVQFADEKELFIKNEQKKHALRLNTKLITTTVMLYPVYSVEAFFKYDSTTRLVIIKFDPVHKKLTNPTCDVCKVSLSELILCNGNHLICRKCGSKCEDCGKISCETCLKQKCSVTKRPICKQCGKVCVKCKAYKNKRFMIADSIGKSFVCRNCG